MKKIPVSGPSVTDLERRYVADAVDNAWYENANVWNARFERQFAERLGVPYAVSLPSCTSALHLSLLALGIGPGDEVVVPDVTWIATAAAVKYVGATVVFADIERDTWCLSADSFATCITPRTRAVIGVDLYGSMPDWEAIRSLAATRKIAVIEDAAEAAGSTYHGRQAGTFGTFGCFSFHGSKTMTTGEGGMLVTANEALFNRVQVLRDHGRAPGDVSFNNQEVAYKYKMSSLQAALGTAQLERLDELVAHRRMLFAAYREELGGVKGVTLNAEPAHVFNSYWMVTAVVDSSFGVDKTELGKRLEGRGIATRPFFQPLSALPAFANELEARRARERNTVAYDVSPRGINLPSAGCLTRDDVATVCSALREALGSRRDHQAA
ncbi:MAG: DegT/DnrJ/EryC1/StrS family aminotransferase [Myxococcaceae bacterium]|nr:DegT/DnrJ/EryC1/StrS family aminotransferase [Myxococcaceae bacterium]